MNLRPKRWKQLTFVTLAVAMTGALLAPTASGQTAESLRERARQLEAELNEAEMQISVISEEMHTAELAIADAQAAVEDAQMRIAAAQAEADRLKKLVNDRAAAAYKQAGGGNAFADLDVTNATDFEARSKYASAAASEDEQTMYKLTLAQEELDVQREESERAREQLEAEKGALDARGAAAQANEQRLAELQSQVEGELEELVARERAARERAEQAQARQAIESPSGEGPSGGTPTYGDNLPSNAGAGGAVGWALAQVGKAYCNNGNRFGPSCFDCSGLTFMAWKNGGGLSIPTVSGPQFQAFPQVSLSAIQPGDLLFRDQGGTGHVAMYTGGGMMVHATTHANNPNAVKHVPVSGIRYAVRPG